LPYQKLFQIKNVDLDEFHVLLGAMNSFLEWPQYDTSTVGTKYLCQVDVESFAIYFRPVAFGTQK
jgi:RIO-like serine/threonine protein kinase